MPELSRFYGVVVYMFFSDHNPPHFHIKYQKNHATINLETFDIIKGKLPRRALALVLEWASLHRTELRESWKLCVKNKNPHKIKPLD